MATATEARPKRWSFVTATPQAPPRPAEPVRLVPLSVATVLAMLLGAYVWLDYGARNGTLLIIGLFLGLALFHSRFGFTSAWRRFVSVGNGAGLRAHALLLGTTATLAALIIGTGTGLFGANPEPSGGPIGIGLFVGAALFGMGMQVGGACASGTLFAVGSGQSAIVLTLGGFIAGSVLYTALYPWLSGWPELAPVVLADHVGWFGSWAVTIVVLLAIVLLTRVVQARRTPPPTAPLPAAGGFARILRGSWPMLVGAVVIAVLAAAVLLVSGGTWGVTSAFALWGGKLLQFIGLHPETWAYWQQPEMAESLRAPIWSDKTSLTNIGIMVGAAIAASAAGAWKLHRRIPARIAVGAVFGGILMGLGARLASGCNIGAYLGGIATGSVSGWLWGVAAIAGTWAGLKLRPLFGHTNPQSTDGAC